MGGSNAAKKNWFMAHMLDHLNYASQQQLLLLLLTCDDYVLADMSGKMRPVLHDAYTSSFTGNMHAP